ncbi:ParA family protein [Helicobacter apodemus]|uniref:ParA family protein n=1 Tax=Helicobacter apodemus TaxID=135569 RepID=A0A4U8UCP7_9HELI|nr:ParA family protein [Helicobacter apodemus]TLE13534.1 ParA family protein [Helicobacter apodemus]
MPVITVAHTKGGVGKSMISWNLAGAFNGTILDLDFQQSLSHNNDLRKKYGLKPFKVLEINSVEEFLQASKKASLAEWIIIDTGGFDDDLLRFVITYADIVITPALESNTELFGLQTFGRILNDLQGQTMKNVFSCVLLNKIHPNSTNFEVIKTICDADEKLVLMDTIIRERSIYKKSFNVGKTIFETTNSVAKAEFTALKKEITKRLANEIVNG